MSKRNHKIAATLREIATLLRTQRANPFRVNAYLHAAETLDQLEPDVAAILKDKGLQGLIDLPAIGEGIARSIEEYVNRGRMSQLESLRGAADPVGLLRQIPTLGRALAERIHETLHVDSFEALESAVRDGRLARVEGIGERRCQAIEAWLQQRLGARRRRPAAARTVSNAPAVTELLEIDREYRARAKAGKLPLIAPKRFNPNNRAWLPIMHVTRGPRHYTALYSNTARAHDLKRVYDWVVIYFYDDHHREGQHTVVTETRGELKGKRVVRGREAECEAFYSA